MEVLLVVLFFITALIFFIAGKDDFGRTESKLIIKENVSKEQSTESPAEEKKEGEVESPTEEKKEGEVESN